MQPERLQASVGASFTMSPDRAFLARMAIGPGRSYPLGCYEMLSL